MGLEKSLLLKEKRKQSMLGIDNKGIKNPMFNVNHTLESINLISTNRKGKHSGSNHHYFGLNRDEITRNKISNTLKNKPKVKCPHCDKEGSISNMKRWHFDNCKSIK
jgi:hypothetical protein